jgi:hypothetical protein
LQQTDEAIDELTKPPAYLLAPCGKAVMPKSDSIDDVLNFVEQLSNERDNICKRHNALVEKL